MKKVEVPLYKRQGKLVLYVVGFLFFAFAVVGFSVDLLKEPFSYWTAGFATLMFLGSAVFGKGLYDHVTQKMPMLVVESDGVTIEFFIRHNTGIANRYDKVVLADMKRFYHVKRRTRLMMTELSFEFAPKSGIFKEEIDPLPALAKINAHGIAAVMQFVSESAPEIEIGYVSPLATLFRK